MENGRCRMHGGASVAPGPLHHNWKHGRNSIIGERIAERLSFYLENDDLADQSRSLAILDMFTDDLLSNVNENGGCKICSSLAELKDDYWENRLAGNEDRAEMMLAQILETIERAEGQAETREEVIKTLDARNRISATQHRKVYDKAMTVPVIQFIKLLEVTIDAINEEINDDDAKMRLVRRLRRLGETSKAVSDKSKILKYKNQHPCKNGKQRI